jgi:hypothetical protein
MPLDCMPRCNLRMATARVMNHVSPRDQTVANYRETVLTGFQQVEDNFAALRILENEAQVQEKAVVAAQKYLELANPLRWWRHELPGSDERSEYGSLGGNHRREHTRSPHRRHVGELTDSNIFTFAEAWAVAPMVQPL